MTFITAQIVAEMTGFDTASAFLRARDRMERDQDFPTPMPTCLRPMKWRNDAVAAWVETRGRPAAATPFVGGPNVILLEEARRV